MCYTSKALGGKTELVAAYRKMNDTDYDQHRLHFDYFEYCVMAATIGITALIGLWYSFLGKQDTVSEYMLGNKEISIIPISLSLIASHISGITLIGIPAEMYMFGTQMSASLISILLVIPITIYVFLPVFYYLDAISLYEYLEHRFNRHVRQFASFAFAINLILYISVATYTPALAVNQVSGMNVHFITPIVCLLCIFYTTLGGLKAVVWTDSLQVLLGFTAMTVITIVGMLRAGGISNVFEKNYRAERIEIFNMDPNPFTRSSFWSTVVGSVFMFLAILGVHPCSFQRFIALPTYEQAKRSVFYLSFGVTGIMALSCLAGVTAFATYHDCDLVSSKLIQRPDQLMPYLVMDIAKDIRGLPGLFLSGVVCAALSLMSAGLNTLSGILFEDFIQPCCSSMLSDHKASYIMKIQVIIIGIICTSLIFIVENLTNVYKLINCLNGMTFGPLLGLFVLGVLFPQANAKGALTGGIASICIMAWVVFGTQEALSSGRMKHLKKPIITTGCVHNFTISNTSTYANSTINEDVNILFRLSFFYYVMVGCIMVVIIGLIISYLTGPTPADEIDPNLISPIMHKFMKIKKPNQPPREMFTIVPTNTEKDNTTQNTPR